MSDNRDVLRRARRRLGGDSSGSSGDSDGDGGGDLDESGPRRPSGPGLDPGTDAGSRSDSGDSSTGGDVDESSPRRPSGPGLDPGADAGGSSDSGGSSRTRTVTEPDGGDTGSDVAETPARTRTPDKELRRQKRLQSAVAAESDRFDEDDIERVERTDDGRVRAELTDDTRREVAQDRFATRREASRRLQEPANADVPLGQFQQNELRFEPTDDGSVRVEPTDDARREALQERAARQDDRFDESDIAVVGVGPADDQEFETRVRPAAAREVARQQLAERDHVDAEDVVVTQEGPDRFVAEEREAPPVSADADVNVENLFASGRGEDAPAPVNVDADINPDRTSGKVAAAGLAGVAAPEPVSSTGGALLAGGAVAGALAVDAARRSEVGLGDGIQRTEVDVSEPSSELAVSSGSAATATEVEVTEPTVQEVEPTDPEGVTEVSVGRESGAGETAQPADDTVVPGEYPLAGRDFAADPRRDAVRQETDPEAVLDTRGAATIGAGEQLTEEGTGSSVGSGTQSEILEEVRRDINNPVERDRSGAFRPEREFPTGSSAVVSEEVGRLESAAEPQVTSGEETLEASERAIDGQVAGVPPGRTGGELLTGAAATDTVFELNQAAEIRAASATGTATAPDVNTAVDTAVDTTPIQETALTQESVTAAAAANEFFNEGGFNTETATGNPDVTVGGPSTPTPRTPGIPTPPIPGLPGGGGGGRGTTFETREDEVFSSGILTGDEAFDLFFGDEDER